jgi:glucose dehydrogenase
MNRTRGFTPQLLLASIFALVMVGAVAILNAADKPAKAPFADWPSFAGDPTGSQFSSLTQITKDNVSKLQQVWRVEIDGAASAPIVYDGVLYAGGNSGIMAINATTGKQIWFNSSANALGRGISLWMSEDHTEKRILYNFGIGIGELDAESGEAITGIGKDGFMDGTDGIDVQVPGPVRSGMPPTIYKDLAIVGQSFGPPATLRAWNIRTGKLAWVFNLIPRRGEYGFDTWGDPWEWKNSSGANNWGEMTVDAKDGILFVASAAPKPDYVGEGHPGVQGGNGHDMNLFSTSLVALDPNTGKRLWHFQMIHHDLFDLDNTQAPKLLTVTVGGKKIDAVLEAGKTGFIYVFDRHTGKPIFPIVEKPVPQTDVPYETTSPTQPFPTLIPPFARQSFTADDIDPMLSPERKAELVEIIKNARNEGMFTPPSLKGSIEMPGNHGGGQYGTGAVDAEKGLFYVSDVEQVALLKDIPNDPKPVRNDSGGRGMLPAGETFTNHWKMTDCCGFLRESNGLPDNSMPWSTLTAYDINKGAKLWQIPFGELDEVKAAGYPHSGVLLQKMTISLTKNGMLFSALQDKKLRVYDTTDGHIIAQWDTTGANAGPVAIFEAGGKEYIVVATNSSGFGGRGAGLRLPSAPGAPPSAVAKAAYTAYALPDGVK